MQAKNKNIICAIVGRPNVGKSTLFNRLIKNRKSIVDDTPGVTRDRIYDDIDWNDKTITFVDTGGLAFGQSIADKQISDEVKKHVQVSIEEADFLIFLVDGTSSVTSEDEKIAQMLRKIKNKKRIFLAVNKIDTEKQLYLINDFYSLGFGEPYPVSAISGSTGMAEILDEITSASSNSTGVKNTKDSDFIKITIVGKPNVGKSSLLNCLVGKERSIVSPIAGTTRDSIDTTIEMNDKKFILIDTAGLRRKAKVSSTIERYSNLRAISSIERADVILFMVDANENISEQDQKIASLVKRRNKPSVILINKWDLVKDKETNTMKHFEDHVLSSLHFVDYSKLLFTSVITKRNINKIWDLVLEVRQNYLRRVPTSTLNKVLENIVLLTPPQSKKGRQLKIYYATQANVEPPEIVIFVNNNELASPQYLRFLEKELRNNFDFSGTPIKIVLRNKRSKK